MDRAAPSLPLSAPTTLASSPKRLNVFERYLSLWVGLCMVVGVVLGLSVPGMMQALRGLEFGAGSQINGPIAILIWLMITPMMMKVDFGSIRNVGRRPRGLFVTLFVNWLVKTPQEVANRPAVQQILSADGDRCLPLILVNESVVSRGVYLSRAQLARAVGQQRRERSAA